MIEFFFLFFKQKTAYEVRISDWSSDVCSSDLGEPAHSLAQQAARLGGVAEAGVLHRPAFGQVLVDAEERLDPRALDCRQVVALADAGVCRIDVVERHADEFFVRLALVAHAHHAYRASSTPHARAPAVSAERLYENERVRTGSYRC